MIKLTVVVVLALVASILVAPAAAPFLLLALVLLRIVGTIAKSMARPTGGWTRVR